MARSSYGSKNRRKKHYNRKLRENTSYLASRRKELSEKLADAQTTDEREYLLQSFDVALRPSRKE